MGPLNQEARREGHRAMEKSLTAAARVRRRFTAGRPRAIQNRSLNPLEAIAKCLQLFQRLHSLMAETGLDVRDVQAGLVYVQRQTPGRDNGAHLIKLPTPEDSARFVEKVQSLEQPTFLGVLFAQWDHEAKAQGKPGGTVFVWPFMAGPEYEPPFIEIKNRLTELLNSGGFKAMN